MKKSSMFHHFLRDDLLPTDSLTPTSRESWVKEEEDCSASFILDKIENK